MEGTENTNVPKMSRRAIREAVFKLLYISGFYPEEEMEKQQDIYFDGVGSDVCENLGGQMPSDEDTKTIHERFERVQAMTPKIDALLDQASVGWKVSRMSRVDLAILRLAVYETLFDESIPVKVAINEAVEIARKYGGEDSRAFVNGILGKIVRDAGGTI